MKLNARRAWVVGSAIALLGGLIAIGVAFDRFCALQRPRGTTAYNVALMQTVPPGEKQRTWLLVKATWRKAPALNVQAKGSGYTLLMLAAEYGDRPFLEELLGQGENPHLLNKTGLSAADIARTNHHEEIAQVIVNSQKDRLSTLP